MQDENNINVTLVIACSLTTDLSSGHVGGCDRPDGLAIGSGASLDCSDSDGGDLVFALVVGEQPSKTPVAVDEREYRFCRSAAASYVESDISLNPFGKLSIKVASSRRAMILLK